jgi:solute carrier family 10 (sodium/bile acid cotransporter), member 7
MLRRLSVTPVDARGSKKSLASGLPMALVLFPAATVGLIMLPLMVFHEIHLVVCAVIASDLFRGKSRPETSPATTRVVDPARPR